MKKISMVKVAVFRVVDQYTREDQFAIISMCPVSKPIKEAKAFFNKCLAKHFACVAECEEFGPMPLEMAQIMTDSAKRETPLLMVFNLLDDERAAS